VHHTAQEQHSANFHVQLDYTKLNITTTTSLQQNNQVACLVCQHLSGSGKYFPVSTKEPPKECKQQQQSKMTDSDDNIKWFHQHCSSNYHFLEPAVLMVDFALSTIKHIKRLYISHVSNKVKSDFFKILSDYSKAKGNLVVFYIEPVTARLLHLIDDEQFNVDNFMAFNLSMSSDIPEQPSPLANFLSKALH
jgi:hypothetical protein